MTPCLAKEPAMPLVNCPTIYLRRKKPRSSFIRMHTMSPEYMLLFCLAITSEVWDGFRMKIQDHNKSRA